jgi:hypothetical protein
VGFGIAAYLLRQSPVFAASPRANGPSSRDT